jgi:hypothetical protein
MHTFKTATATRTAVHARVAPDGPVCRAGGWHRSGRARGLGGL